ncbi:MAG: hypothetical protein LBP87_03930 [Planctomycetaceae bacterium]|nr:hypothetical protein [Planctomycetaceae bacterium]
MLTDSLDIASQSSPQVGSVHNRMTYCFVRKQWVSQCNVCSEMLPTFFEILQK